MLVALFPLGGGGAVCLQLQDEADLRRGGVYLARSDDPDEAALAPRFDELFADASTKVHQRPALKGALLDLLRTARDAAKSTRPRLEPSSLEGLRAVGQEALALQAAHPSLPGAFTLEELVLITMLIFVSEEERYPRPRYLGGDKALERFLSALGE